MNNCITRAHIDDPNITTYLTNTLCRYYEEINPDWQNPTLILCIGTDRSTGDSLGPLVGTYLQKRENNHFKVFGTLDAPLHAINLTDNLQKIFCQYSNPFILAVDACLGRLESVGCISIRKGPLRPGAGVNKDLPAVGHVSISGIVNVGGYMEFMVLQNTRLSLIMKMADLISKCITNSIYRFNNFISWRKSIDMDDMFATQKNILNQKYS